MSSNALEFGQRIAGISYQVRPGAYAIIVIAEETIAIVKTASGFFLPGGGIERNETHEMALILEMREECGWDVIIQDKVAEAVQYVHARGEGYFAKHCFFYRCSIHEHAVVQVERDHETLWLDNAEAREQLKHESQSWAVTQAIRT